MEFIKTELPTGKAFISSCGEFKAVKYGEHIFLFKKIDCYNPITKKKYRAFGNSVQYDAFGKSKKYKTFRDAFMDVDFFS